MALENFVRQSLVKRIYHETILFRNLYSDDVSSRESVNRPLRHRRIRGSLRPPQVIFQSYNWNKNQR
jgi:hypothetical protein